MSVVLGAGGVRGMAHIGALEVLQDAGFQIAELLGTSVGALIAAFHGALGFDLAWIRQAGLGVRSHHLLAWGAIRRLPEHRRRRWQSWAGEIPAHIARLARGTFDTTHNGVSRIGIVAYDRISKERIVCHNVEPILRLEDAVRGAIAVPGLFPAWRCEGAGVRYELVDGGDRDRLSADVIFAPPFQPEQVLVIELSNRLRHRQDSVARVERLRARFPHVPTDCLCVDTMNGQSLVYRHSDAGRLLEAGRRAALEYLRSGPAVSRPMALPRAPDVGGPASLAGEGT